MLLRCTGNGSNMPSRHATTPLHATPTARRAHAFGADSAAAVAGSKFTSVRLHLIEIKEQTKAAWRAGRGVADDRLHRRTNRSADTTQCCSGAGHTGGGDEPTLISSHSVAPARLIKVAPRRPRPGCSRDKEQSVAWRGVTSKKERLAFPATFVCFRHDVHRSFRRTVRDAECYDWGHDGLMRCGRAR